MMTLYKSFNGLIGTFEHYGSVTKLHSVMFQWCVHIYKHTFKLKYIHIFFIYDYIILSCYFFLNIYCGNYGGSVDNTITFHSAGPVVNS